MSEGQDTAAEKENYIKALNEDLRYSTSKFDGQTLAISGGALGISLSFIKDIVPFESSIYTPVLYAAQFLFTFAITIGFISHYLSLSGTIKAIERADANQFNDILQLNKRLNKWINRCNRTIVWGLPLGIFLLVVYSLINIENARGQMEALNKDNDQQIMIQKDLGNGTNFTIGGDLKSFEFTDTTKTETTIKIK